MIKVSGQLDPEAGAVLTATLDPIPAEPRLLCAYHHTWVHQRGLTATLTAHDVTWHT